MNVEMRILTSSLSHWSLYGCRCGLVSKFIFETNLALATLVQLPPSMIEEHNFPWMRHLAWKIYSLWQLSNSTAWIPNILLIMNISPSDSISSSLLDGEDFEEDSLIISPSSLSNTIFLVVHWEAIWPLPKHLKHLISLFLAFVSASSNLFCVLWVVTLRLIVDDPPFFLFLSFQPGEWKLDELLLMTLFLFNCCST